MTGRDELLHPAMRRGVFITDTGVGKSRVGAALAHLLRVRGVRVRPRKPVESGCSMGPDGLVPHDAAILRAAAGGIDPVCPYRLQAPLSPERAAELEGMTLCLGQLHAACLSGIESGDFLLVEGAGGFYSPLASGALNADLAGGLGLPVLMVAADRLGTLNHTLLTVEAVRMRGLALAGLILNQPVPQPDPAMDNAADLARWLQMPVLRLPHTADPEGEAWKHEAALLAPMVNTWFAEAIETPRR